MNPQFAVLNPCHKQWTDLDGEGRERFCATCQTPVHENSQYTPKEWQRVWTAANGHVCGTMTAPPAPPPRTRRAILLGALLTAVSPLLAKTGSVRIRVTDPSGVVLTNAVVAIQKSENVLTRATYTNAAGEVVFEDLPLGKSQFFLRCTGFEVQRITVIIKNAKERQVSVQLAPEIRFTGVVAPSPRRRQWWRIF